MVYQKDYDNSKISQNVVEVKCTGCGRIFKAIAINGRVFGYCSVVGKRVEALVVLH